MDISIDTGFFDKTMLIPNHPQFPDISLHFPGQFVRGENVALQLLDYCHRFGQRIMVTGGRRALEVLHLHMGEIDASYHWFGGECSDVNIEQLVQIAQAEQAQVLVAVGGGKALDTGKTVAEACGLPVITIPTILATCSATTSVAVRYFDNGCLADVYHLSKGPDLVLVDTALLAKSPCRWLSAGLGDTLSKWYEYRSIQPSSDLLNGLESVAAFNRKLCYELIESHGARACRALETQTANESLKQVADAILLYAGMTALMSRGEHASAAHGMFDGFTVNEDIRNFGHGLLVGYGNLVLLALEGRPDDELMAEIELAKLCRIPTSLRQIKADWQETELLSVLSAAANSSDMRQFPSSVTVNMLACACKRIDALSESGATF